MPEERSTLLISTPESPAGVGIEIRSRLERTVAANLPGSRVLGAWKLEGGISARMTSFEVELADGIHRKLVARQPGARRASENPSAVRNEFDVVRAVHRAKLPVPEPLWLEPSADPFFVLEFIDGNPDLNPGDREAFITRFANQLAAIHRVSLDNTELNCLVIQDETIKTCRGTPDSSLREGEIRAKLDSVTRKALSNMPVLRHGDFWPGNILWREGEIVAIVDWEEALIGEALADLAICRLDILWILGSAEMEEFTRRYLAQTTLNGSDLPYWDLWASLRPIGNLAEWAASYPPLGRPEVTLESMTRDHNWFVEQALKRF